MTTEHHPHHGHHEHHEPVPDPPTTEPAPTGPQFTVGQEVHADFDGVGAPVIAILSDTGHVNEAGETKFSVQNPATGEAEELTYREPGDDDAGGTGRTFWLL